MWVSELFVDWPGCMVLPAFLLMHHHSLQYICADITQSVLQKLQTVQGGSAFSCGRLFCSCIHSHVTSFPQFESSSCLSENIPSLSFWLNVTFKLLYAFITFPSVLKLSLQAFSWKNDPGRRFLSANLVNSSLLRSWGARSGPEDLVSKQDIYEREGAGLEILNREVGMLGWGTKNECVH